MSPVNRGGGVQGIIARLMVSRKRPGRKMTEEPAHKSGLRSAAAPLPPPLRGPPIGKALRLPAANVCAFDA